VTTQIADLWPDDDNAVFTLVNLENVYQADGRLDETIPLCERGLALQAAKFDPQAAGLSAGGR
jgi:hypothetical protein